MRVRPQRLKMWQAIEEEFGEPLVDIIAGLRAQHCSWPTVAGALGIHRITLLEWRRALGLPLCQQDKVFDLPYKRRSA